MEHQQLPSKFPFVLCIIMIFLFSAATDVSLLTFASSPNRSVQEKTLLLIYVCQQTILFILFKIFFEFLTPSWILNLMNKNLIKLSYFSMFSIFILYFSSLFLHVLFFVTLFYWLLASKYLNGDWLTEVEAKKINQQRLWPF